VNLRELILKREGLAVESGLHRKAAQLKVRLLHREVSPYLDLAALAAKTAAMVDSARSALSLFRRESRDESERA
jgi:hypothetical protein